MLFSCETLFRIFFVTKEKNVKSLYLHGTNNIFGHNVMSFK